MVGWLYNIAILNTNWASVMFFSSNIGEKTDLDELIVLFRSMIWTATRTRDLQFQMADSCTIKYLKKKLFTSF